MHRLIIGAAAARSGQAPNPNSDAAMEAEVADSVTGDQIAAVVQAGVASQFKLGNFSTVSDIKNVIDRRAMETSQRLDELRAGQ